MNAKPTGVRVNVVRKTDPAHNKANPGDSRKPKVIICFRCGQEGHIAADMWCPEAGKKPSYAQMCAAHSIILDAMADSVGAEDHPKDGDDIMGNEPFDMVEMEFYDQEDESDKGNATEEEQFNQISVETPIPADNGKTTEDEIVYGNPMEENGESIKVIPLFEFGGPIPDIVVTSSYALRVACSEMDQPNEAHIYAMTEVGDVVWQQGQVNLHVAKEPATRPTQSDK